MEFMNAEDMRTITAKAEIMARMQRAAESRKYHIIVRDDMMTDDIIEMLLNAGYDFGRDGENWRISWRGTE